MKDLQASTRFGTTAEWTATTLILGVGETGYNTTTKQTKVGDGTSAWSALPYDDSDDTVLTSLNGTKYGLVVSNAGVVTAVAL